MAVLKIDQDAKRDDRRAELAKMLREAVWGDESTKALPCYRITAAVVAWHVARGTADAINAGIDAVVEAASLGLLKRIGLYWRPVGIHDGR